MNGQADPFRLGGQGGTSAFRRRDAFRRDDPAERRQRIADVLAAGFLYRFASRQLVAKLSADNVIVPLAVVEAIALVEQWVAELLPDRPG